jgi:uncharacterized membrane protein YsdA (DUF1294 family)/cold shock CspA family protein
MKQRGQIIQWDAARGYGFIATADGQRNIFVHVRDVRGGAPQAGLAVEFELIQVGGKGPRAMAVVPVGAAAATPVSPQRRRALAARRAAPPPAGNPRWLLVALLAALVLLGLAHARGLIGWPALGALLVLNAITFVSYAVDKSAAEAGRWRTPEQTLHALALAGGWPAAGLAQSALRHKSSKPSFQRAYLLTVLANLGALAAWLWLAR